MTNTGSSDITNESDYYRFIKTIKKSPNREWANKYLDWMKDGIKANSIRPGDECFATTLSDGKYEGIILEGNARCIKIMPADSSVDVLMPRKLESLEEITKNDPSNDRSYGVNTSDLPNAKYYWLNAPLNGFILEEYKNEWIEATKVELSGPCSNRSGHRSVIYRTITSDGDRKKVLDDAF